jgi:surface antigen
VGGVGFLTWAEQSVGRKLDEFRGVAVYDNGPLIAKSHGRHFGGDGYYFGQKWQCVEYVKRFFHQAHDHRMPDVWGHAKEFFDDAVPWGQVSPRRGLVQFRNGGAEPPRAGDLVVFTNGFCGHVAIVCAVRSNEVEVIQQNTLGRPRDVFSLTSGKDRHQGGEEYAPAGWLRVPPKKTDRVSP